MLGFWCILIFVMICVGWLVWLFLVEIRFEVVCDFVCFDLFAVVSCCCSFACYCFAAVVLWVWWCLVCFAYYCGLYSITFNSLIRTFSLFCFTIS